MTTKPRNRVGVTRFSWAKLEAIKVERGLQWKTIAKDAGVTAASIRLWHKGVTHPTPVVLRRIAGSLGVTSLDLMDGSTEVFTLADYRDMAGYSATQAARLIGMRLSRLGDLERGTRPLRDSDVAKLAELYEIPSSEVRAAYTRPRA